MIEALCVGHAAWDISVWVPSYPSENSKAEIQTMVSCSGGPAANAACLLAKWGVAAGFSGTLGADEPGAQVFRAFREHQVNTAAVLVDSKWPTPVSVIVVNEGNGSRTIMNRSLGEKAHGEISLENLSGEPVRLLHFDGHELAASLRAMELWRDAITVLDAGSVREGTLHLASRVNHLVASERFVCQHTGLAAIQTEQDKAAAIAALYRLNGRPVVITLGEAGVLYGTEEQWKHLPAFPAKVVDTTGAGDSFHGAFSYGVLRGMSLEAAVTLAAAAGALAVEIRGSSLSIPDLEKCMAFPAHV